MASNEEKQLRPLILDMGTDTFRMGWAGDDFPDILSPSVNVDISDYIFDSDVIDGLEEIFIKDKELDKHLYGHEALDYQNILKIHEFQKEGNYNILLKFFLHYYNKLQISEENRFKQPLIILTPFFHSDLEKNKLQYIFFKNLNFPSILFLPASLFSCRNREEACPERKRVSAEMRGSSQ